MFNNNEVNEVNEIDEVLPAPATPLPVAANPNVMWPDQQTHYPYDERMDAFNQVKAIINSLPEDDIVARITVLTDFIQEETEIAQQYTGKKRSQCLDSANNILHALENPLPALPPLEM